MSSARSSANAVKRGNTAFAVAAEVQSIDASVERSSRKAAEVELPAPKKRKISSAAKTTECSVTIPSEITQNTAADQATYTPATIEGTPEAEIATEIGTRPKRNASVKANAALGAGFFPDIDSQVFGLTEEPKKKKKRSLPSAASFAKSRAKAAEALKPTEASAKAQPKKLGRPPKVKKPKTSQSDEETEAEAEISPSSAAPSSSQQADDALVSTKGKMAAARPHPASPEIPDDEPSSSQSMATIDEERLVAQEGQLASATNFSTTATSTSGTRATTVDGSAMDEDQACKAPSGQPRTPSSKAPQKWKQIGDDVAVDDGMTPQAIIELWKKDGGFDKVRKGLIEEWQESKLSSALVRRSVEAFEAQTKHLPSRERQALISDQTFPDRFRQTPAMVRMFEEAVEEFLGKSTAFTDAWQKEKDEAKASSIESTAGPSSQSQKTPSQATASPTKGPILPSSVLRCLSESELTEGRLRFVKDGGPLTAGSKYGKQIEEALAIRVDEVRENEESLAARTPDPTRTVMCSSSQPESPVAQAPASRPISRPNYTTPLLPSLIATNKARMAPKPTEGRSTK